MPHLGQLPTRLTPSTILAHFHFSTQGNPLTSTSTLGNFHFHFHPKSGTTYRPARFHFPLPPSSYQLPLPPCSPSLLPSLLPPTSSHLFSLFPPPNFLFLFSLISPSTPSFPSTPPTSFLQLPPAFLPFYPLSSTPSAYLPSSSSFPSEICYTRVAPRCTCG